MKITALKLRDARFAEPFPAAYGVWDYDDFLKPEHEAWFNGWVSFDCLLADDKRHVIWCGLACMAGDIFWAFDRKTRSFRSLGYPRIGDRYDAKFHRALLYGPGGEIWAATALLHEIDRFNEAPGGAIVRFDPGTEEIRVVGRPLPHLYIQSVVLDPAGRTLIGQTYTPELFFRYDLESGRATTLGPIGSGIGLAQAEQLSFDRHGTCWGAWGVGRAWANAYGPTQQRLWRFEADAKKPEYLPYGLPRADGQAGYAKVDGTHAGPDGAVYMGTMDGLLCRIDPGSGKPEVVGKPAPGIRLAAMANGPDGKLYGVCGRHGTANLFSCEPGSGKLVNLGPIFDPDLADQAHQIHNLAITADGTIYAGENDVPHRSSYLWEISGAIGNGQGGDARAARGGAA